MYSEKNLVSIVTMLECVEKCRIYTAKFSNPHDFLFAEDQLPLNGVISLFIAIGEESKKIESTLVEAIDFELNWSDIAKLRDKISHDYRRIDPDVLWSIVQYDLPKLKNALLDSPCYQHLEYLR